MLKYEKYLILINCLGSFVILLITTFPIKGVVSSGVTNKSDIYLFGLIVLTAVFLLVLSLVSLNLKIYKLASILSGIGGLFTLPFGILSLVAAASFWNYATNYQQIDKSKFYKVAVLAFFLGGFFIVKDNLFK